VKEKMLENVQTFTLGMRKLLVHFVEKDYGSSNLQQAIWLNLRLKREPEGVCIVHERAY
jgi:hypothetical protein